MSSVIDSLASAKPSGTRYPYIQAGGTYDLVVKAIEEKSRTQPTLSKKFAVEVVVESAQQDKPEAVVNSVGSQAVAIFDMLSDIGLGNFMGFLCALTGQNITGNKEAIQLALKRAPGARIRCTAVETTTKKGNPFTRLNWQTLENNEATLTANRKKYNITAK